MPIEPEALTVPLEFSVGTKSAKAEGPPGRFLSRSGCGKVDVTTEDSCCVCIVADGTFYGKQPEQRALSSTKRGAPGSTVPFRKIKNRPDIGAIYRARL
jgi:hypothetical protein